jgi:hypothetical protein
MDMPGESLCKRIIHVFNGLQGFIAQKLGAAVQHLFKYRQFL